MSELIPWRCPGCGNWYDREQTGCYECGALNPELSRAAEWVYEAARLEALASERPIVPEPWAQRDQAFRDQFETMISELAEQWIASARLPTPEEIHDSWMRAYEKMGWRYGPERDPIAKTHPDMVPFDALPEAEREKDAVFLDLVKVALRWICKLPPAVL